jgi:hypothetical protein
MSTGPDAETGTEDDIHNWDNDKKITLKMAHQRRVHTAGGDAGYGHHRPGSGRRRTIAMQRDRLAYWKATGRSIFIRQTVKYMSDVALLEKHTVGFSSLLTAGTATEKGCTPVNGSGRK